MFIKASEKGQALILIALAAIGLFAFAALAIDGSRVYSDKRHAQNAVDTAAMAGALAYSRADQDDKKDAVEIYDIISNAAQSRATSNGYDDNGTTNEVTISIADVPPAKCPKKTKGKDITVTIVSHLDTTIARVIGRNQVTYAVTATSRVCDFYVGPPFDGNAIVALAPSGKAYDGTGTPKWLIEGGGIFSNSSSSNAAYCNGAAEITAPSVTVVQGGGIDLGCHKVTVGTTNTTAPPYTNYESVKDFFPDEPTCEGDATLSGGKWYPDPSPTKAKSGSKVAISGDMDFTAGLYCVTNSPGPYHGALTGTHVTFYIMSSNFSMKFDGSGNYFHATAPTSGDYEGVLMYLAPQVDANGNLLNTQELDLRGNGNFGDDIVGTIIAPSADVTMFGNSGTGKLNTQVIAYHVDSGGNANIHVKYNPDDNLQVNWPNLLSVLE